MSSELDLKGHGIGKLFAPLALRQAAKQVSVDHEKFTELLESGAVAAPNRRCAVLPGAAAAAENAHSSELRFSG